MKAVKANQETARLEALHRYEILDSGLEQEFDNLTRLAALICRTPNAAINLIDANRQWFKSSIGLQLTLLPREVGFCPLCIQQGDLLIIPDTLADARFATNSVVTSYPYIRFYAGAPLITPEGHAIGVLCVFDQIPQQLQGEQIEALSILSCQVINQLEARRDLLILGRTSIERQQAESEIRFQAHLLDAVEQAVIATDLEGNISYWNRFAETLYGWSAAEVVGRNILEVTPTQMSQEQATQILSSLQAGESWSGEFLVERKDGTTFPAWVTDSPIHNEQGELIGIVGVSFDISDRKQAERQIRKQAALLDVTTDAILVRSINNQILFWNKGAERLYGWKAEEVLHQNANQVLYPASSPELEEAKNVVLNKGEWHGELKKITKAGEEIIVQSRWTLMRDRAGQPKAILTVSTDITQKKQLEQQFLRAQRLESIGTLAGGIAHDLNNVLAPILMAVQLLERKLPDESSQRLLKTLENNAKRGSDLVRQILSFARGIEANRTIVQVRHLIAEMKQIAKETFPKSIEFQTDIPRDLWAISGNATQLHQVLINLCVNARDAMPEGGTLSITAENILIDENYARMNIDAKKGSYIAITVTDTGTGIAPEIVERIFEPFFTTKELGKGTGLGLSTVIGIIKGHGGFVQVFSNVGQGTQFKIYLPAMNTSAVQQGQQIPQSFPNGNNKLILVVDDEAAIREITKESLETYAYKVLTASDGIEAIALYAQHKQDISAVLVDMMMPSMDGPTTIRMLKKMNPQVKIITVSGLTPSHQLTQDADSSVKAFLSKPYTAKELLNTIHSVINSGY